MKQFQLHDVKQDEFDDLPASPGTSAGENTPVDASGDASMFDGVPEMGEVIPMGTYHFRLDKWSSGLGELVDENKQPRKFGDGTLVPKQPWFLVQFVCQQEPHTGRNFGDFCPWVSKEVREKALAGDAVAREILKDRLWKAKSILGAASFKPAGSFDIEKDFFSAHPEMKIQLGLQEGKAKNAAGKYVPDGSQRNKAIKYLSLTRPV